jgi:hypothetical protein
MRRWKTNKMFYKKVHLLQCYTKIDVVLIVVIFSHVYCIALHCLFLLDGCSRLDNTTQRYPADVHLMYIMTLWVFSNRHS